MGHTLVPASIDEIEEIRSDAKFDATPKDEGKGVVACFFNDVRTFDPPPSGQCPPRAYGAT